MAVSLARRLVRTCRSTWQRLRFWRPGGYRAAAYWDARHEHFGFDPRGVGDLTRSDAQNRAEYEEARAVFLGLCERDGVAFAGSRVLEIGCGNGFYTETCFKQGCDDYTGVDISDRLFPGLCERWPSAVFRRRDVSREELRGSFDIILMIDVTQHIVDDNGFLFAMDNIQRHLAPGGTVVLTSWLSEERARRTQYEVVRPLDAYQGAFAGWAIAAPVRFRDKYLFSVSRAPEPSCRQA